MNERAARARREARNAAQWLARLARSYAGQRGEIALDFDAATRRLLTPEVAPGIRVGLALPTLVLQFEEHRHATPHPFDPDDKSSAEIEAWLLIELLHRGFDRESFSKRLPYEWPGLMSGDEAKYAPHDLADELGQLARQFVEAATVLGDVWRLLHADANAEAGPSPTCRPRRFDLGLDGRTAGGEPVRIGFVPGDDAGPNPCFVVESSAGRMLVEMPFDAKPRGDMAAQLVASLGHG